VCLLATVGLTVPIGNGLGSTRRLLVDFSLRTKAGPRIRYGLAAPLAAAAAARGWLVDVAVPAGAPLPEGINSAISLGDHSDLVLDELVLPRLAAPYDVVYTQREGLRIGRRLGRRKPGVVLHLHEHQHVRYAPSVTVRHALRGAWQSYRACAMYRRADHICFSSEWTRAEFPRLERIEPTSSSVVRLGGWPDDRPPLSIMERRPIVVVIASSDARDELDWALAVWRLAMLPYPWELVVVGRAPHRGGERVRAVGRLSDADLVALLAMARAYLHIGRVEGFGLSVVEALQVGTPVVGRGGSAVDELLRHGGGYLVDDAAAAASALTALADGAVVPAVAAAAGARYTWAKTARGVLAACDAVIECPGPAP